MKGQKNAIIDGFKHRQSHSVQDSSEWNESFIFQRISSHSFSAQSRALNTASLKLRPYFFP
ncbi:hypothetical protein PSSHI_13620 [Photobacterium sp. R1]